MVCRHVATTRAQTRLHDTANDMLGRKQRLQTVYNSWLRNSTHIYTTTHTGTDCLCLNKRRLSGSIIYQLKTAIENETRMWANAQRDGSPAEYRWRPLFNAAKFGRRALLECRAVTLPRRETRWKLQGCSKLAKRSQPLLGRSSPYYQDMWRLYCCLKSFFSDCRYMP